jgi:hypothetical protein
MIEATKTGPGVVSAEGIEAKHRTPTLALCRALLAAGHADQPMTIRDPDGRALMTVRSIAEAAKLTVVETSYGPRFAKWAPHPGKEIYGDEA